MSFLLSLLVISLYYGPRVRVQKRKPHDMVFQTMYEERETTEVWPRAQGPDGTWLAKPFTLLDSGIQDLNLT